MENELVSWMLLERRLDETGKIVSRHTIRISQKETQLYHLHRLTFVYSSLQQ